METVITDQRDPITGLLLREGFEAAVRLERSTGAPYAVAIIDVDHLEHINRTRGFAVGDALLRAIGDRLKTVLSSTDLVCRIAGDSFGVLVTDCGYSSAKVIAERLRRSVDDHPFPIADPALRCSVSVGITVAERTRAQTLESLLSEAHAACATAKETGRNTVIVASSSDDNQVAHRREATIVQQIRSSVDTGGFVLHTQEIHPLGPSSQPPAAELLIRMRADQDLLIGPDAFIPRAEENDLIHRIDLWVLQELARQLESGRLPERRWFINISPKSISVSGFVDELSDIVRDLSLGGSSLCFELTETAAVDHFSKLCTFIEVAHDLGAKVALDDFGSGMSSLSQLRQLDVDYLKIDGSLTRDVATDPTSKTMIIAIGSIAVVRNMVTIAEHVESREEAQALHDLGIHLAQGWHFSRPTALSAT